MIKLDNASFSYPGTENVVLKDINLHVSKGEFIGVLGPTGSGKTTLCLTLCGLIPKVSGGKIKGNVYINGLNVKEKSLDDIMSSNGSGRTVIGITFQDPESQIIGMSVEEDIAFGLEHAGISSKEIKTRMNEALKSVNMEGYDQTYSYALSGGQKQRVAIASAIALRPDILILDEPTSELDPVGREEVFAVIEKLRKETQITIIMVEHEIEELVKYATRCIVLDDGQILFDGLKHELFNNIDLLIKCGIRIPEVTELGMSLNESLDMSLSVISTIEQGVKVVKDILS